MKRTFLLAVVVGAALAWPVFSIVSAAQAQVTAPIRVGWEIRPTGGASNLLPTGSPLTQHPDYHDFQDQVTTEIKDQLPSDTRNAWPFNQTVLGSNGHKAEEEIRQELDGALTALNTRRDEIAAANSLPDPPDFSLASGGPIAVEYTYWNDTKECSHKYALHLDGTPWELTDGSIPATATFYVSLSWTSRID